MSKKDKKAAAPQMIERLVGFVVEAPKDWPAAKRKLYTSIERSLLEKPEFNHLTVLPTGCLLPLYQKFPVSVATPAFA